MITRQLEFAQGKRRSEQGMTLVEVLVSFAISLFTILGIAYGYLYSTACAERFSLSQAATAMALERLEQTRCAQWVTSVSPGIDQLQSSNFPSVTVTLDLSGDETRVTYATNITTIANISTSPPMRLVHVDCYWTYGITGLLMSNSIETIRSPE